MRKTLIVLTLVLSTITLPSTIGLLYSNTQEPVAVTSVESYTKSVSGTNFSIMGLIGLGDSSVETLTKQAGITQVKHIDKETTNYLLFFITETYTIYGN